jgi:hypothetical protein
MTVDADSEFQSPVGARIFVPLCQLGAGEARSWWVGCSHVPQVNPIVGLLYRLVGRRAHIRARRVQHFCLDAVFEPRAKAAAVGHVRLAGQHVDVA